MTFSTFLSDHTVGMLSVKAKNQMCHYLFVFSRLPELEGPVQFLQGAMCHLKCAYYTASCNSYDTIRYVTIHVRDNKYDNMHYED